MRRSTSENATGKGSNPAETRARRQLLAAGWLAGALLLAVSLVMVVVAQGELFSVGKVERSLGPAQLLRSPALVLDVGFWLAVLLALHLGGARLLAGAWWRVASWLGLAPTDRVKTGALVLMLAAIWVLAANGAAYPRSLLAGAFARLAETMAGYLVIVGGAVALTGILLAGLLLALARWRATGGRKAVIGFAAVAVGAASSLGWVLLTAAEPIPVRDAGDRRPDLIVIGIDSLRPDHVSANGFPLRSTPALDDFLSEAVIADDTVTPLARTFPAWVSILTGREPVEHGARFNLVGVTAGSVAYEDSIARRLSAAGYHTLYATDEKRFSNIDAAFGFDRVAGPPIGAADFLVGTLGDVPLANLVSNTRAGRRLLPYIHGNRAAVPTYRPETFVRVVDDAMAAAPAGPMFAAIHLCLPHWPYRWSAGALPVDSRPPEPFSDTRLDYLGSVIEADRQFGEVMALLERHGRLANALVVVLSDHGESFSLPKDTMTVDAGDGVRRERPETPGHGTDLFSASQHGVLLSIRRYGRAPLSAGRLGGRFSLIDVAPTLLDGAGLDGPGDTIGVSLLAAADPRHRVGAGPSTPTPRVRDRVLALESGITAPALERLDPDVAGTIAATARYYTVSRTGRVVLKPAAEAQLLADKQRAVYLGPWQAVAVHDGRGGYRMAVANTDDGVIYAADTLYKGDIPTDRLRQALCRRFATDAGFGDSPLCRQQPFAEALRAPPEIEPE